MEQTMVAGTAEMETKAVSLDTGGALRKPRGSAMDDLIRQYTSLLREIAWQHGKEKGKE
jgi:hypothetical protein